MTPTEPEAIDAFERLGLTSYEAKVFIALQQLGTGSAREVANVTDVPRSQVYSVADRLEERGLLDVQQSSPIRYRAVGIDEAKGILQDRFETERERAFEYVDAVRNEADGEEEQEAIWTVRGNRRVDDRVVELISDATDRIVFGTRVPAYLTDSITETLIDRANSGLDVTVVSRSAAVRSRFEDENDVAVTNPPAVASDEDDRSGRLLIVDTDSVLLSVVDDAEQETAIWSANSLFASVLVQLIEGSTQTPT
ncbi:TrmB family transcriptional regulator [Halovivax gelatinilyticus]|uniref:TrmB family transcriptional regulator n=1 Tax=Halovivax gelatinilyticus TaxID=2961597 RepID=UPI0020CA5B85|nr:helix-turn-helix domain-containing protein [Halovivax gelatinilyticus]